METTGMIIRMVGALAIIMGIIIILAWITRRWMPKLHSGDDGIIQLRATKMISPKRYVSVVKVGNRNLILGIGEHEITLLGTMEEGELTAGNHPALPPDQEGS